MSSYLNDVHAEGLTTARFISPPTYYYSPMLVLKYVENKYMVVESAENGITRGFIVNKVNGISVANMEDSLRPYLSSGNDAVFHRSVSSLILNGSPNSTVNVEFIDNSGAILSKVLSRSTYIYQQFFYNYYPNDTLKNVAYKKISCGVGYVNMGILQRNEVSAMYNSLKDAPAIIFDIRNYPNGTVFQIADFMFPNKTVCAKFKIPDVNYPGTFYWDSTSFGYNNNSDAYNGKVILLVDEETQSHAEYSAMILKAFPGAMVVGSQTAGADGNVVNFNASWDIKLGYTGVGVYWPDGTNTQRVGIAVDVASNPTRVKLTARRDEVLEAGLKLANCFVSDINLLLVNQFNIYPNPSTGIFKIETNFSTYTYKIFNSLGKEVSSEVTNESNEIDLSGFENGIYTVVVYHDNQIESKKITLMR
jgi:C-terminal processing protease CtpA/Prc